MSPPSPPDGTDRERTWRQPPLRAPRHRDGGPGDPQRADRDQETRSKQTGTRTASSTSPQLELNAKDGADKILLVRKDGAMRAR
ncbi:hypothetical protein EYF80_063684 [Liparis tanakae]|uniref:Uncharacterized protein n=1 Tax=Liparis tanakae TaxID=230148 RepID=A0A4Z2EC83_9TELE|nr:hypothetical protein EYF80_063684 [Liparis tanakae]